MTEASIWFDYHLAMEQASALDRIASEWEGVSRGGIEEGLRACASGWKGECARHFRGKGEQLQERMSGTARRLRAAAEDVRAVARQMRAAEMANLALAQDRSYQ